MKTYWAGILLSALVAAAATTQVAAAAPLRVTVLVEDSDGKPVPGARIAMEPRRPVYDETLAELVRAASGTAEAPQPPVTQLATTSDSNGRGELVAPSVGMYRVHVSADGKAPVELDLTPLVEATILTPATLTAGTPLTVTVSDPAGQPLANAWVELELGPEDTKRPWDNRASWRLSRQRRLTGADGTARFQAAARTVAIAASKAGFVGARWRTTGQPLRHDMRLTAGELRQLVVRDSFGRLVDGAVARSPRKGTWNRAAWWVLGRAGERGRLRVAVESGETAEISVLGLRGEHGRVLSTPARPTRGEAGDNTATSPEQPAREVRLLAPLVLNGRVLDAVTRLPIADAVVWAAGDEANGVNTDQHGNFTLTTTSTELELHAAAANRRGAGLTVAAGERFTIQPTLLLEPAVAIRGRVVDASRRPIAGAAVQVNVINNSSEVARRRTNASQDLRTDSAGKFVASGLPTGAHVQVFASATGFASASNGTMTPPADGNPAIGAPPEEIELVLTRGQSLSGRLVDPHSRPVAGARVELVSTMTPTSFESLGSQPRIRNVREGRSGVDGKFTLDGLAVGRYRLTATAPGFSKLERPGIEVAESVEAAVGSADALPADATSGTALDLGDLELTLGVTLHGEVVDRDGVAIAGAVIAVLPTSGSRVGPGQLFFTNQLDSTATQASSNDQGQFTIVDLTPGTTYELAAHHQGYASAFQPRVSIDPAKPPVRIVMQRALMITGSVVDERGVGLPGASVGIIEGGDATGFMYHRLAGEATSDDRGSFAISGVPPVKVEISADLAGWVSAAPQSIDLSVGGETRDVVIVLRPGGTVHGRVTDLAGDPIAGVHLDPVRETVAGWSWGEAFTDGDGVYTLGPLPPGRLTVAVAADGYVTARRDLSLVAGDNRLDVTLEGGHPIAGTVVDPDGAPVPDANVSLTSSQWHSSGGRTDQNGHFSLAGVVPGPASLVARATGYASTTREINVGREPTHDLVLQLAAGSTLTGWIRGLPETELAAVDVTAVGRDGMWSGTVAADGSYRIEHLAAGFWHVQASVAKREVREQLEIVAGSPATLDLTFGKGLQLSGVVTWAGAPLAAAMITLRGLDVPGISRATCDQEGRFTLSELTAGTHRLEVAGLSEGIRHFETIELASDQELTIDVVTGRLSGRLIDEVTGEPVAAGTVWARPVVDQPLRGSSSPVAAMSDASGHFSLGELSPGRWRLEASATGYQNAELEVELAPGNREETVLRLGSGAVLGLHVSTASGAPLDVLSVGAVNAGGQVSAFRLPVGEAGRVETKRLPAGLWTLYLSSSGASVASISVSVPGEAGQVVLPLAALLVVRVPALADDARYAEVAVTDTNGRPFWAPGWQRLDTTFPLAWGRAELRKVPAGTWQVTVTAADGRRWTGITTVSVAGPNELVLE